MSSYRFAALLLSSFAVASSAMATDAPQSVSSAIQQPAMSMPADHVAPSAPNGPNTAPTINRELPNQPQNQQPYQPNHPVLGPFLPNGDKAIDAYHQTQDAAPSDQTPKFVPKRLSSQERWNRLTAEERMVIITEWKNLDETVRPAFPVFRDNALEAQAHQQAHQNTTSTAPAAAASQ